MSQAQTPARDNGKLTTPFNTTKISSTPLNRSRSSLREHLCTPDLMQVYQQSIKMVQENKINLQNMWDNKFLNSFGKVIRKVDSVGQGGLGLEAAAKLYFARVQNLHTQCVQSIQSYTLKDERRKKSQQQDEDDSEQSRRKSKQPDQQLDPSSTLAKKQEDINRATSLNYDIQQFQLYQAPQQYQQRQFALATLPIYEGCYFEQDLFYIPFRQNQTQQEELEENVENNALSPQIQLVVQQFQQTLQKEREFAKNSYDFQALRDLTQILKERNLINIDEENDQKIQLVQFLRRNDGNGNVHFGHGEHVEHVGDEIGDGTDGTAAYTTNENFYDIYDQNDEQIIQFDSNNNDEMDDISQCNNQENIDINQQGNYNSNSNINYLNGFKESNGYQNNWGQVQQRKQINNLDMEKIRNSFRALTVDNKKPISNILKRKQQKPKCKNPNLIDFESEIDESQFQIKKQRKKVNSRPKKSTTLLQKQDEVNEFESVNFENLNLLNCSLQDFIIQQTEIKQSQQYQNINCNIYEFDNYDDENENQDGNDNWDENYCDQDDNNQLQISPFNPSKIADKNNKSRKLKYYFKEAKQPDIDDINKKVAQQIGSQIVPLSNVQNDMKGVGVSVGLSFLSCLFLYNQEIIEFENENGADVLVRRLV